MSPRIVYRAVALEYVRVALSPKGSRQHAGRFNRQDTAATYYALEPQTAYLEYQVGNPDPLPVAIVAARIEVERIVDLVDPGAPLAAPWDRWTDDWKDAKFDPTLNPASWRCADAALEEDCSGILFPSQVHGAGTNLVVYPEDASVGLLKFEIIDPKRAIHATMSKSRL